MPGWLSPWELLILLAVVLPVFGPKRLPELGRSPGAPEPPARQADSAPRDRNAVG
jgi:hypothetical protein